MVTMTPMTRGRRHFPDVRLVSFSDGEWRLSSKRAKALSPLLSIPLLSSLQGPNASDVLCNAMKDNHALNV